MEKIIESLPYFMVCIALGFIFLRTFRHMCTIKNSENHEHIIWESLFVGFILRNGFSLIPFSINQTVDILGMTISTFVLAIVFSKMYSSNKIDYLFRKIGVYRTRNNYIWKDLEDPEHTTIVKVVNPDTNETYSGFLKYYEEYERHPQIVLQRFQYCKKDGDKPTIDCSNEPEKIALVDTEKFSKIFIVYSSESDKVKNKDEKKTKKNSKHNLDSKSKIKRQDKSQDAPKKDLQNQTKQ